MADRYLRDRPEPMPPWLQQYSSASRFNREEFFNSRVVLYPGSGSDGQPVKLFASTHSAHCFIYADYGLSLATLENELEEHGFRGYHIFAHRPLEMRDLAPAGVTYHVQADEAVRGRRTPHMHSYGFLIILERDPELDSSHGPARLAILFLGADGIATFDALFCQDSCRAPFAVVVQDHGFGGNYDRFDRGGLLEEIAQRCEVFQNYCWWRRIAKPGKALGGY